MKALEDAQKVDKANLFLDPENERDVIHIHNELEVGRAKSSDPRDRIYALFAMSTLGASQSVTQSRGCFHIDYDESVVCNFTRLAEYVVNRDGSVLLLLLNDAFPRPPGAVIVDSQNLPSWVPDWRFDLGIVPRPKSDENNRLRGSKARVSPSARIEDAVLHVDGYHIGGISDAIELEFLHEHAWLRSSSSLGEQVDNRTLGRANDSIFILEGTRWPVVLKPVGTAPLVYRYVGPPYLSGRLCAYSTSTFVEIYLQGCRIEKLSLIRHTGDGVVQMNDELLG